MANNTTMQQPTIPVKKSDGTIVRMTLDEFKKYRETGQHNDNTPSQHHNTELAKEIAPVLATSAPVKDIFVDEAQAKVQSSKFKVQKPKIDDLKKIEMELETSLLEEPMAEEINPVPMPNPRKRIDVIKEILPKLSFPLPVDLAGRLESLAESRARDIRDDGQFVLYACKKKEDGGLGLNPVNAEDLLKVVKEVYGLGKIKNLSRAQLRDSKPKDQRQPTSVNKIKSEVPPLVVQASSPPPSRPSQDFGEVSRMSNTSVRPPMRDILPPQSVVAPTSATVQPGQTVGPVEEIRVFSLVDFRRLGETKKAGEILVQKFLTLKQESYLLFLEAQKAWQESPLYQDYLHVLKESLVVKRPVAEVAKMNGMNIDEFNAVVEVGKELGA